MNVILGIALPSSLSRRPHLFLRGVACHRAAQVKASIDAKCKAFVVPAGVSEGHALRSIRSFWTAISLPALSLFHARNRRCRKTLNWMPKKTA